ncbi:MAG: hypothetical protein JNL70_18990 [Saprospiraceae bacterium]|nr:hypothetical protein [Saprospiraceae bacterium]
MRITEHKLLYQRLLFVKLLLLSILSFTHLSFSTPPSVSTNKKDFAGIWQGKAQVDYGEGFQDQFEYELLLTQKGKKVVGYSTTVLKIGSRKYVSKSLLDCKIKGKTLICKEVKNVYEDKLPNGWALISKMELTIKDTANYQMLNGFYQMLDKTGGRLVLEKKPPRV